MGGWVASAAGARIALSALGQRVGATVTARVVAPLANRVGLAVAPEVWRLSQRELNAAIGDSQRPLLNAWIGQGAAGARSALASGELPAGVTRNSLLLYRVIILKNVALRQAKVPGTVWANDVGVLRLRLINWALRRSPR